MQRIEEGILKKEIYRVAVDGVRRMDRLNRWKNGIGEFIRRVLE